MTNNEKHRYIYHLPYLERVEVCKMLNVNGKWEELAGVWMGYDVFTIESLRKETNPTDKLLTMWGFQNHNTLELFVLLYKMKHYQAMVPLKPFVNEKYHRLIYNEEGSLQHRDTRNEEKNDAVLACNELTLPHASYDELCTITNDWNDRNKLGKGSFGTVYRGFWKNTDVAVKKIEKRGALQQSLREIKFLNCYRHQNILPLYAYSLDGKAPCLVYQLMINGSVEDKLQQYSQPFTWLQRHQVAKGTARGLHYLHAVGEKPLIHGSLKTSNILLDHNLQARIGDFGLAREGPEKDSMKVSKIHGARPYLPKEYLYERKLSTKVDTYSFGIVLFELATGLPAYDDFRSENKYLKDFIDSYDTALHLWIDKKAGEKHQQVYHNLIVLGKWCADSMAQNRPEMDRVFKKLNDFASRTLHNVNIVLGESSRRTDTDQDLDQANSQSTKFLNNQEEVDGAGELGEEQTLEKGSSSLLNDTTHESFTSTIRNEDDLGRSSESDAKYSSTTVYSNYTENSDSEGRSAILVEP